MKKRYRGTYLNKIWKKKEPFTGYRTDIKPYTTKKYTGSYLRRADPDYVSETLTTKILFCEESQVTSWRGKRKPRDEYGWDPPNAFSLSRVEVDQGVGSIYVHDPNGNSTTLSGHLSVYRSALRPVAPSFNSIEDDALGAMEQAQHEAYAEANSPACPGLIWIAEGIESLVSLRKLGMSAYKLSKNAWLRSKFIERVRDPAKKAEQLASHWLAYRYAIQPLMLQIADIIELLCEKDKELKTTTGYVKATLYETNTEYATNMVSGSRQTFRINTQWNVRGACKLYPAAIKASDDYGFKLHDALSAAWELFPLSFVVDWFVNIGDWIAAYRPGNAGVVHQSNTYVAEVVQKISLTNCVSTVAGFGASGNFGGAVAKRTEIRRTINVGVNSSLPVFTTGQLSLLHKADAVALIFLFFKGIMR